MYAVMLLLGLSMVNNSCNNSIDNSIEGTAKRDAKAYYKALDDGDDEAKEKAKTIIYEHAQYYDMNGKPDDYARYEEALDKYLQMYLDSDK